MVSPSKLLRFIRVRGSKMQQWQPRKNRPRRYRQRGRLRHFQWGRLLAALLGAALLLFGMIKLIGYGKAWAAARKHPRN